ncbi:MAG: PD40 domain-containing protein [Candidatus Hydrogenedentes bacterium]|nr:PD40 domain-containing protein [Candidatus Hydrogenedentota bacterium]
MPLLFFLSILSGLLGQSKTVAYVTGDTQQSWCLTTIDINTGATTSPGQGNRDSYPRWSPSGSKIAYQSTYSDSMGIRIVDIKSQTDISVPHIYAWNQHPRWAPDGKRLAYSSAGDTPPLQAIIVYDLETGTEAIWGGNHRGLMRPIWMPTTDMMKALDPEDEVAAEALGLLALKSEAEESGVLMAIGMIGTPPEMTTEIFIVTPSLAIPLLPFLASDSHRYVKWFVEAEHKGRQLAFESNDGGDRELFVLGRKGIINVSNHPAADWNPVWSPDNDWLAFESFRGGRRGLYRLLVSTANVFPIAANDHYDCWSPSWSPDGNHLVFVSNQTGTPQLFIASADGTTIKPLTDGTHPALAPVWQPKQN